MYIYIYIYKVLDKERSRITAVWNTQKYVMMSQCKTGQTDFVSLTELVEQLRIICPPVSWVRSYLYNR